MKRVFFKVVFPALAIGVSLLTCYFVCDKPEGFDWFLFWILAGFPYGIHKMRAWLIPRNYGIAGSIGVMALNAIIGGLIGVVILIIKIGAIIIELIKIIAEHFWTQCPEVKRN